MAKKLKRQVSRSAAPVVRERAEAVQPPVQSAPAAYTRSVPAASEFNPDYSYVISDLKRIGTLAGTFIVILIILSFFLR